MTITCYACQSPRVRQHSVIHNYEILRCDECQLLWVPKCDEKDIQSFYNAAYFKSSDPRIGYCDYLGEEDNHRENARELLRIIGKYTKLPGTKILDIGCAYGFLLAEAKKLGCECFGIEQAKDAYTHASKHSGASVSNADLLKSAYPENHFDLVLLIGSIEHLRDPIAQLKEVRRILKPDGLLVITTIDTKGILPVYKLKPPEHLFYFSHQNLRLITDKLGFSLLRRQTYFVRYRIVDFFERASDCRGFGFLKVFSSLVRILFAGKSCRFLTNEMLLVLKNTKP